MGAVLRNIGPRSWQYGPRKTTEGQYSPVRLELAGLGSSLLNSTRVMLVFNLPAKKYTACDRKAKSRPKKNQLERSDLPRDYLLIK